MIVTVLSLVILAILGIGIWILISFTKRGSDGEEIIASEVYEDVTEVYESDDVVEVNTQEVFQNKVSELIDTYGLFDANQYGVMHTMDDAWMNPKGIMSATVLDFDSDGVDELLVCYTKLTEDTNPYTGDYYRIVMNMYEVVDGEAVLADHVPFATYCDSQGSVVDEMAWLSESQFDVETLSVHAVEVNGNVYIMCEEYSLASSFADGMYKAYWMMEYTDGKLEYVCSFTQTGAGSSEFRYAGYDFSNGMLVDSNLYYCEDWYEGVDEWNDEKPLYDDFTLAITEFFKKYGIELKNTDLDNYSVSMGTILSATNEKARVFEFINKVMKEDYERQTFEYQATLSVGTNDILEQSISNVMNDVADNVSETSGDYILPESNFRILSMSDLEGLTAEECRLARNEIYARHGRKFEAEDLQEYFGSCEWYQPTIEVGDFQESMLNDCEIANRDLIVEYEKEKGYR